MHALTAEDWTWLDLQTQRLEAAAALLRGLACIAGEAKEGRLQALSRLAQPCKCTLPCMLV
jgi:hypothetical protein